VLRAALIVCLLATAILKSASLAAAAPALPHMSAHVIDQYLVPRFAALETAAGKLTSDLEATCGGKAERLTAAREDFKRTALAWAQVEFLRFGPLSVTGRPERFSFWPDPRDVMQRQLRALIAERDPAALDAKSLAGKSAAIQGLPALEALLWNDKQPVTAKDEEGRYRCALAAAIAQNLTGIAHELAAGWSSDGEWRHRMLEPGPQNPSYKTAAEPAAEFARALITGLQMIQDRQVAPLIAAETTPDKPPRLPFAQSGLSADYIAASVAANKALYDAMGLDQSVPHAKQWMPRWITMAFGRLAEDAPAAVRGKPSGGKDPDRAHRLRFVRFHVEGIRKLIGRELAPLAGLTIGFNELDGD
jgi:predicted lipoprotein